jgi:ATP-dependent Clp protease adapter protein ClpS
MYQIPLHSQRVGVWCAINARRIVGLHIPNDTVNPEYYVDEIFKPFFHKLTFEE